MKPPSFEPWVGRVRLARACISALGFAVVVAMAWTSGMTIDDAMLRGLGAAVVCYFVGWASALWVCSELHNAQIGKLRRLLQARDRQRQDQLQQMYDQRMAAMNEAIGIDPPMPTFEEKAA